MAKLNTMKLRFRKMIYRAWRYRLLYLWRFIATSSWPKIYNFIMNRLEYKRTKIVLKSLPPQVVIDITNICNLKCPLCPTGTGKLDRNKGKMNQTDFEKLLDQLKNKTLAVHLYNWGEPLLLKNFSQFCKTARQRGFVVSTSSNLSMKLDREQIHDIINSGLDRLIVSFDGLTGQTYKMYRHGGDYKLLLDNLKSLVEAKKSFKSKYPLIILQLVKHRGNQAEVSKLPEICYQLGADSFQVVDILLPYGEGANRDLAEYWLTEDRLRGGEDDFEIRKSDLNNPCPHLWKYSVINHDGTISPCCFVYLKGDDIAELRFSDFKSAWNSERYQKARKMFADRKYTDFRPCSSCPIFKSYMKTY